MWNVVLARIYDAKCDSANAIRQYRRRGKPTGVAELLLRWQILYARAKDLGSEITTLNKTVEISNDDPEYVKRLITALEKAGRHSEAEIARQKLPQAKAEKSFRGEQFAEAERMRDNDRKAAADSYRQALIDPCRTI